MSRANFVQCQLANPITASANTLTVKVDLPAYNLPPTDGGLLVLMDAPGRPSAIEIIQYASRSGAGPTYTLSGVTRGIEGTVAQDWPVDTYAFQSLTAGELDGLLAAREPTIATGTTAQYWRGDKSWRDFFTDVRAATLAGLSTSTNAVITASDTVLSGLGKLQKQISDAAANLAGNVRATVLAGFSTASAAVVTASDTVLSALGKIQGQLNNKLNVGDFGLGSTTGVSVGSVANTPLSLANGMYIALASDIGSPGGMVSVAGYLIHQRASASATQIWIPSSSPTRMFTRTYASSAWTAWVETWHSGNLVKQDNPLDASPDKVFAMFNNGVGPFGLGSVGSALTDVNNLTYSGLGRVVALGTPNAPTAGTGYGIGMPHAGGMTSLGGQLFLNYTTDSGNYVPFPRLFARSKSSAAAFGSWAEFWSSGNTPKQTNASDTTPGAMLVNGSHGIGIGLIATDPELDNYLTPGKYLTPATGLLHLPAGFNMTRHTLEVIGYEASSYSTQMLATVGADSITTPRVAVRSKKGPEQGWTSWGELWHSANFDPNSKASLSGATFTGSVVASYLRSQGISEGLRLTAPAAANAVYATIYNNTNVRVGFVGKGNASTDTMYLAADIGEVALTRPGLTVLISDAAGCTLGGVPKAATAAAGTNTTQLATTAFVQDARTKDVEATASTAYTLVLADQNKHKRMTGTSAVTVTIPPNSSVAFKVSTEVDIERYTASTVTIAAGAGVTIRTPDDLTIPLRWQVVTLKKVSTDEWILIR